MLPVSLNHLSYFPITDGLTVDFVVSKLLIKCLFYIFLVSGLLINSLGSNLFFLACSNISVIGICAAFFKT